MIFFFFFFFRMAEIPNLVIHKINTQKLIPFSPDNMKSHNFMQENVKKGQHIYCDLRNSPACLVREQHSFENKRLLTTQGLHNTSDQGYYSAYIKLIIILTFDFGLIPHYSFSTSSGTTCLWTDPPVSWSHFSEPVQQKPSQWEWLQWQQPKLSCRNLPFPNSFQYKHACITAG